MIEKVRDYIRNQEEHHKQIQFQQEYDEFISKYEFPKLNDENNNLAKAKIDFKYIYPPAKAGGNSKSNQFKCKLPQINWQINEIKQIKGNLIALIFKLGE